MFSEQTSLHATNGLSAIAEFLVFCDYDSSLLQMANSVSQSYARILCGRSDCPPLRTILCQRKCIGQRHSGVGRDVAHSINSTAHSPGIEREGEGRGGREYASMHASIYSRYQTIYLIYNVRRPPIGLCIGTFFTVIIRSCSAWVQM